MKDKILRVYQDAVEVLQEIGYGCEVYEEYSCISTYGRTVTGIVTDAPEALIVAIIMECAHERYEELDVGEILEDFVPTRSDSMGLSCIYY